MRVILNDHPGSPSFERALDELTEGADTLSVAVSYMQIGGWDLFLRHVLGLSLPKMRIICTDQFGFTQPIAIQSAIRAEVQIRVFSGDATYHPKVYLAHDARGQPKRCLLGSANLSSSAFTTNVEAGILWDEPHGLTTLHQWFDELFERRSVAITPDRLLEMEARWRAAAAARARNRLDTRWRVPVEMPEIPIGPEDVDTLEDVFATIQLPIGLLNMDYAGNNIRNIDKAREVIENFSAASEKQRSELKLLGFMEGDALTALGREVARARSNEEFTRIWCRWLQQTEDADLERINARLLVAKRVFPQFWTLRADVRDYFLANARSPEDRLTLQTIELLCNAQYVVQDLTLGEMQALSRLLQQRQGLPPFIRGEVEGYFDNKGTRSWDTDDRRTVPIAWREAADAR